MNMGLLIVCLALSTAIPASFRQFSFPACTFPKPPADFCGCCRFRLWLR